MDILNILYVIASAFLFASITADLITSIRNLKYQKMWNRRKSNTIRINPAITNAELCEKYVRFCKRNNCKVDF